MSEQQRPYDSTVARVAGNVAGAFVAAGYIDPIGIADKSLAIADEIVKRLTARSAAQEKDS